MKRGGQLTLSLGGTMRLVPASRSPLAVPAATGQPDAEGPMEQAAKRAKLTEVDPELQVPAAQPATLAAQPQQKKIKSTLKKEKVATHVTWVKLKLRILYGGIAIAADLALTRVGLLSQQLMHVAGFIALSLFCCERENATNGSSMSHLRQRPTRGANIAARGGSTTARKFAIVPSRRARAILLDSASRSYIRAEGVIKVCPLELNF